MKYSLLCYWCFLFGNTLLAQNLQDYTYKQIDSLVRDSYQKADFKSCLSITEFALNRSKKAFGEEDSTHVQYLSNQGFFYRQLGEFKKAEPIYVKTVALFKKIHGEESELYARALNNLGGLYKVTGRIKEAIELQEKTNAIKLKIYGEESLKYALVLTNLGALNRQMGRLNEAEGIYLKSLGILERVVGKKHKEYLNSLNNLAVLYENQERFAEAELLTKNVLSLAIELYGKDHPTIAQVQGNLGGVYIRLQKFEKAKKLYESAVAINQKKLGKEHPKTHITMSGLALTDIYLKNYEAAENIYRELLELRKKKYGKQHPEYALGLHNLAGIYNKKNHHQEAISIYLEAAEIFRNIKGDRDYNYLVSLSQAGSSCKNVGNLEAAWDYFQQSLKANSGIDLPLTLDEPWEEEMLKMDYVNYRYLNDVLVEIFDLLDLDSSPDGNTLSSKRRIEKQMVVIDLAMKMLKKKRDLNIKKEDKLRFLEYHANWTARSLRLLFETKNYKKAFVHAEQNKSVFLLETINTEKAYGFGNLPDSLMTEEQILLQDYAKMEAKIKERRPAHEVDSIRRKLNELNLNLNAFKKRIEKAYPEYAAFKYKQEEIKPEELQALLDEKTAVLEFVVAKEVLYIFYMDNQTLKLIERPIKYDLLTQKIKTLHMALSDYEFLIKNNLEAYQIYTNAANWFYQELIAPALDSTKALKHLIIIPDGEIAHLPFETFLTKAAPQSQTDYQALNYLVKKYQISYNYSATLWKENKEAVRHPNNGQMLAMAANYDVHLDSSQKHLRLPVYNKLRGILPALPSARNEVVELSEAFDGFFGLDSMANEAYFKKNANQYAVIHLAMHGLLDSKHPMLSSLAFTENGDSLENNFLQAYEISKMKLNAELVVLSACETGFGKFEEGNGIASLARAFMYAGASSLVVSLWQVNDHATAVIMKSFYTNLNAGMDKAAALQQAKLTYMRAVKGRMAHPAFWSPFIQIGDSKPIQLAQKGGRLWLWTLGILGTLLLLLIGLKKITPKKDERV